MNSLVLKVNDKSLFLPNIINGFVSNQNNTDFHFSVIQKVNKEDLLLHLESMQSNQGSVLMRSSTVF